MPATFALGWMPATFALGWMPATFALGCMPATFALGWMPTTFTLGWTPAIIHLQRQVRELARYVRTESYTGQYIVNNPRQYYFGEANAHARPTKADLNERLNLGIRGPFN
jgi:hypothetical protein